MKIFRVVIQYLTYTNRMIQKNKRYICRRKKCMKLFYQSLKEDAMEIFNFEKRNRCHKQRKNSNHIRVKFCHICKKKFEEK